jgi:hypothetical protein
MKHWYNYIIFSGVLLTVDTCWYRIVFLMYTIISSASFGNYDVQICSLIL